MKKVFKFCLLVSILFSNLIVYTAQEGREERVTKYQQRPFESYCVYNPAERKRLLEAGENLHLNRLDRNVIFGQAVRCASSESIAILELMVRQGVDLEQRYGASRYTAFRYLLQSGMVSLEDKIAKFKILMDAGVTIDFSLARAQKAVFDQLPEYSILEKLFKSVIELERKAAKILPDVIQDCLPAESKASTSTSKVSMLIGEYAYPYYGNQYHYYTPEEATNNPNELTRYLTEATKSYDLPSIERLLDLGAHFYDFPPFDHCMDRLQEALKDEKGVSLGVVQLLVRKGFDVHRSCKGMSNAELILQSISEKGLRFAEVDVQKLMALMEGGIEVDFKQVAVLKYSKGVPTPIDKEREVFMRQFPTYLRGMPWFRKEKEEEFLKERSAKKEHLKAWGLFERRMLNKVREGSRARAELPAALEPLFPGKPGTGRSVLTLSDLALIIGSYAYPYYTCDVVKHERDGGIYYEVTEQTNNCSGR